MTTKAGEDLQVQTFSKTLSFLKYFIFQMKSAIWLPFKEPVYFIKWIEI